MKKVTTGNKREDNDWWWDRTTEWEKMKNGEKKTTTWNLNKWRHLNDRQGRYFDNQEILHWKKKEKKKKLNLLNFLFQIFASMFWVYYIMNQKCHKKY